LHLTLNFGGGTSLIDKGKRELRRKIKALKRAIEDDLQTSGFDIVSSSILNEYKFIDFELKFYRDLGMFHASLNFSCVALDQINAEKYCPLFVAGI
jgi:hypothetical protein